MQRERLALRPAGDLLARGLGHRLDVALHALAVERRQQQLALAHVLRVVEQQHGVLAERRAQDHVRFAGVEDGGIAREHLLDHVRVGEHHDRPDLAEADREHVAVLAVAAIEERPWAEAPRQRLAQDGLGGPGRQHRGGHVPNGI